MGLSGGGVEMFHLDEYVGTCRLRIRLAFRKYLRERLIDKVGVGQYHLLDGTGDAGEVARACRQRRLIAQPAGGCSVCGHWRGNGHLAFQRSSGGFFETGRSHTW